MPRPRRPARRNRPGAVALVTLLALSTVAVMVIGNRVFIIKEIMVEGTRYCSKEEVIQASGIVMGSSMFSIDSAKVRDGVNADRYLNFVGMWRDFPSRVILTVSENAPRATLMRAGMLVMLGDNGVVLEETSQIDITLEVPMITGALVESCRVGFPIVFSPAGQLAAVLRVLAEADKQGLTGEITELNVAQLDNLYFITRDGLQVMLGNSEALEQKVELTLMTLPNLRGVVEVRGAVLDVSAGVAADFRPPQ